MRILILGGDGMLGHRIFRHLRPRHDVGVTLRQDLVAYRDYGLFDGHSAYAGIDVRQFDRLVEVVADFAPDAIVNCVGIVKQRSEAKDYLASLEINALLPHRLALVARTAKVRLVHISTDCVFSGRRGNYREDDPADPDDLYGRSKLLGEISAPHCVTLRTSMIGPELARKSGLLEWFLSRRGNTVKGFTHAIYSGFTTAEMSRIIERILVSEPAVEGLYQVSSAPISKYDLLCKINAALGLGVRIIPDAAFKCDRSLDSRRFREALGYTPPSWDEMVAELARELA